MKRRALDAVLSTAWAITPEYMEVIAAIAEREHEYAGNIEALEAKLGRPLGNSMRATVRDGVAIIPMEGPLMRRASLFGQISGATSYESTARDLAAALEDPSIDAVLLNINSPGGQVEGVSDLAAMVAGADKPVWAYTDGTIASAAYWVASAADRIVASDTAIIGSIGVMMGMTEQAPKAGEKSYRFVSSQSPMKNADPGTEAGAAAIQSMVDDLAAVFIDTIAKYRGLDAKDVQANFGQGGVFVAQKALDNAMIDGVGNFESTLAQLKQEIKSMDYTQLTAASLAENRPDIVAAIRAEAVAGVQIPDVTAARKEATEAERARIAGIQALAMPGTDALVASMIADGTSQEAAAVKILQAVREGATTKASAHLDGIKKTEAGIEPPKAAATDDPVDPIEAMISAAQAAGVIR